MIAVVDYGAGNLTSVKKALDYLGAESQSTSDPAAVARADKIILPGVGHFAATTSLEKTGLRQSIVDTINRDIPYLGICVGMQWMCRSSQEARGVSGLGILPAECEHFPGGIKCPHVGWNALVVSSSSRLLAGVPSGSFAYFTHSFRVPLTDSTSAETEYGGRFSAAVERDHVFGVQFHPEKSGELGLAVLRSFLSC
jgi:imidazole glycerol-phosphate synthase subunit HisH